MIRLGKESDRRPADVIQAAISFFGPGGVGLAVKEETTRTVWFEGGGGHVLVQAQRRDEVTEIDVEAREWEHQARQFLDRL